jgi:hypothetical protein
MFTTIDSIDYHIDGDNYRNLITDAKDKLKLIFEAHEGYDKTY